MLFERLKRILKRVLPPTTSMMDSRLMEIKADYSRVVASNEALLKEVRSLRQELDYLYRPIKTKDLCLVPASLPAEVATIKNPLVVSVASYGLRIEHIAPMLLSLASQTIKPDLICLMLPKRDFPQGVADVPLSVLSALRCVKAKICWIEDDLGCHNKYYWVKKEIPQATLITLDDDIRYPADLLAELVECSKRHPQNVIATRTHLIEFNNDGSFLPYRTWKKEQMDLLEEPSFRLLPTGVGGVLYPPGCFSDEVFDASIIKKTCPKADDLWLKAMELVADTKVVASRYRFALDYIDNTQDIGLFNENLDGGDNDTQWSAIMCHLETTGQLKKTLNKLKH